MQIRIIPRLDIKNNNLIKGVHLEGLRVVGDPRVYAKRYYDDGADELVYVDVVASLYGRNSLHQIIRETARCVFIPLTVVGGIRTVEDVKEVLHSGADKVGINTAAINRPQLIKEVASKFGSQCMVLSIEAKRVGEKSWESYTNNGRERTGIDVVKWAQKAVELGAGEIFLTSIDQEGTRKGFDLELVQAVTDAVDVPVVASGGMGALDHMLQVVRIGRADAVAIGDLLHYDRVKLTQIREFAAKSGLEVRNI